MFDTQGSGTRGRASFAASIVCTAVAVYVTGASAAFWFDSARIGVAAGIGVCAAVTAAAGPRVGYRRIDGLLALVPPLLVGTLVRVLWRQARLPAAEADVAQGIRGGVHLRSL